MTPAPENVETPAREYQLSNSRWFWAALTTILIMVIGIGVFVFVAFERSPEDCRCSRSLLWTLACACILLVVIPFFVPVGRWIITENGTAFRGYWTGKKRELAWNEIEQILLQRGVTKLRGHGVTIAVIWTSLNKRSPDALELTRSKLAPSFDLTDPPVLKEGMSPWRIAIIASSTAIVLLAPYLNYVRDPVAHDKSRIVFEVLFFLFLIACVLAISIKIRRFRYANRALFGWRSRRGL